MKIVGVTSCPVGVAHTYMAAETLDKKCKELGYDVKIETQGANGAENVLTEKDIKDADYVILALGKGLPGDQLVRFEGKKLLEVQIAEVLKDVDKILNALEKDAKVYKSNKNIKSDEKKDKEKKSTGVLNPGAKATGILNHLMAGVSAALPFIIGGGLMIAIAAIMEKLGVAKVPIDLEAGVAPSITWIFDQIGNLGFMLMVPVMGAFIASSIGSKPAFAPAFVCSYLGNNAELLGTETGAGFLGAVVIGLAVGYAVKWLLKINLGKYFQPLQGFFFIPLITFLVFGALTYFVIGPFASLLMNLMLQFLESIPTEYLMLGGFFVGALHVSDMGGPLNKAAWFFEMGMLSAGVYTWYAVGGVVQMMPPMAAAIACWVAPKLFTEGERGNAVSTIVIGATCATEAAIPYALAAPLPMFSANILSGGITGAIVILLGIERTAPSITILDPVFGLASPAWAWYLALAIGLALNTLFIVVFKGIWLKRKNQKKIAKK